MVSKEVRKKYITWCWFSIKKFTSWIEEKGLSMYLYAMWHLDLQLIRNSNWQTDMDRKIESESHCSNAHYFNLLATNILLFLERLTWINYYVDRQTVEKKKYGNCYSQMCRRLFLVLSGICRYYKVYNSIPHLHFG